MAKGNGCTISGGENRPQQEAVSIYRAKFWKVGGSMWKLFSFDKLAGWATKAVKMLSVRRKMNAPQGVKKLVPAQSIKPEIERIQLREKLLMSNGKGN